MRQSYIGSPVKRIEDPRLITGRGQYVDDISLPGMLFVSFLRSEKPHARIKFTNKQPWMVTGADINPGQDFPIPTIETTYVGQPLVAVIGRDRYEVQDLLEEAMNYLEYEPLPYVLDPLESLKDEVKVYSKASNINFRKTWKGGNPESSLKQADYVIDDEIYNQRVIATPLETRGSVAYYDGQRLNFWSSTQSAHYLRRNLANFLKTENIHVIQPDVGGAFGSKIIPHPEELALAKIAMRVRKPLKWIPSRREELSSAGHGRDKRFKFKAGFRKDGKLLAITGIVIGDLGAPYAPANEDESGNVKSSVRMLLGNYDIRDAEVEGIAVYTNKPPSQSYRGAGRPEATYFIERIMNIASMELGIDPIEIRRRNVIRSLPYTNAFGISYDSGDYMKVLDSAEEAYRSLKAEYGDKCIGVSMYVEITAFGPWEVARSFVKSDGTVIVMSGTGPHGQGDATAFAQIAADLLEVDINRIEVRWGDTDIISDGIGTWGSRTLTVGGSAVYGAVTELRRRLTEVGAKALNSDVEEVYYEGGNVIREKDGKSITFNEIVSYAYSNGITLDNTYVYNVKKITSPYGVHIAVVDPDRETGLIKVLKYVAIDDIGTVVNPLLAQGQVVGGVLQGMSQALYEEAGFDGEGNLSRSTLGDYWIPTSSESFTVRWTPVTLSRSDSPVGSKGVGEVGAVAGTPTIVNAVEVCLKERIRSIPISPEVVVKCKNT